MKELLRLLAKSRVKAENFNLDAWEYAVELEYLLARQFDINIIREAMTLDLCERRVERLDAQEAAREFIEISSKLGLPKHSCLVITELGMQHLREIGCEPFGNETHDQSSTRRLPQWDREAGVLEFSGQVIKRFKRPAQLQFLVLDVFEEEKWPSFIHDPIPPEIGMDAYDRLKGAKDGLNRRHQTAGVIRFGVRDGNKIGWVRKNRE